MADGRVRGLGVTTALLALAGCVDAPPPLPPTEGDAVPESALLGEQLAATFRVEGAALVSPALDTPAGATRAGFLLELTDGAPEPDLSARGVDGAGTVGAWVPMIVTWREGRHLVGLADLGLQARRVEMRLPRGHEDRVASLVWSAVVPMEREEIEIPPVAGRALPLRAELSDLVIPRSDWGARATRCSDRDVNKTRMAIHHTVTPADSDPGVRLRGIQAFHQDTRGWCDIGYHFLITLDGRVWEGRDLDLLGTHVGGNNTGNIGISFIGCFHTSGCEDWTPFSPPDVMVESAATMVTRLSGLYDIAVSPATVKGHRDHDGATTSCPGDNLHARLDDIRAGGGPVIPPGPVLTAEYVTQTFPLASEPFEVEATHEVAGFIEMRNTGDAVWAPGEVFLGTTEPRDGASALRASDWVGPNRAATIDRTVAPGDTGRFQFSVRAPETPGDYPQYFNLVMEGVAWFTEPPDAQLQVRVTSIPQSAAPDAGPPPATDAGAGMPPAQDAGPGPEDPRTGDGGGGGCGCRATGGASSSGGIALLVAVALAARRRRALTRRGAGAAGPPPGRPPARSA